MYIQKIHKKKELFKVTDFTSALGVLEVSSSVDSRLIKG